MHDNIANGLLEYEDGEKTEPHVGQEKIRSICWLLNSSLQTKDSVKN